MSLQNYRLKRWIFSRVQSTAFQQKKANSSSLVLLYWLRWSPDMRNWTKIPSVVDIGGPWNVSSKKSLCYFFHQGLNMNFFLKHLSKIKLAFFCLDSELERPKKTKSAFCQLFWMFQHLSLHVYGLCFIQQDVAHRLFICKTFLPNNIKGCKREFLRLKTIFAKTSLFFVNCCLKVSRWQWNCFWYSHWKVASLKMQKLYVVIVCFQNCVTSQVHSFYINFRYLFLRWRKISHTHSTSCHRLVSLPAIITKHPTEYKIETELWSSM